MAVTHNNASSTWLRSVFLIMGGTLVHWQRECTRASCLIFSCRANGCVDLWKRKKTEKMMWRDFDGNETVRHCYELRERLPRSGNNLISSGLLFAVEGNKMKVKWWWLPITTSTHVKQSFEWRCQANYWAHVFLAISFSNIEAYKCTVQVHFSTV